MDSRSVDVCVRRASVGDAAVVAEMNAVVQLLHHQSAPHMFKAPDAVAADQHFSELLADPSAFVLLAERAGAACGYLFAQVFLRPADAFMHELRGFYIHHLSVDETHRGQGIARQLVTRAEDEARSRGLSVGRLDTASFNTPADRTFAALGYQPYNVRWQKDL